MPNAVIDQLVRESLVIDAPKARVDQLVREALVILPTSNAVVDQLIREGLVVDTPNAAVDQLIREGVVVDVPHARIDQIVREALVPVSPPVSPNMPIIYPLTIPTALGESKADLTKFDAIGEFISEFTGNAEQQQWQDQHWELEIEWPEMTWAQFAAFDAFIGALHGKLGSFVWGPPLATSPRGSGSGTPVLGGVYASGSSSLGTTGWSVSASGLLLPGDFLQLGPYLIPIGAVQVTSGQLSFYSSISWSLALSEFLEGATLSFSGLTSATWLNGAVLEALSSAVHVGGGFNIVITMATVPPGMPGSYAMTSDTGNATAGPARLHQYVDSVPLASDGSGDATFDIFPCMREALPSGSPITLINPQGTFRLADNRRTASADAKKTLKLKLKCREAI
jgi:hypothetical protein